MNIGLGIGIPFTRSSLWSNIFTPTALFMDGSTEGVWYDPSDIKLNWRRNLLTYSEQFDNGAWVKTRASVTTNTIAAPDGTLTADKLVEDATTGQHYFQASTSVSGTITATVYAKAGERSLFELGERATSGARAIFNLSNGTIAAQTLSPNATITNIGNGWYRCSITASGFNSQLFAFRIQLNTSVVSDQSYTGDGTSGIYIWGAQLEQGSTSTEYQRITDGIQDYLTYQPLPILYQDAAGTTPVTAVEQPVGLMLDKSKGLVLGSELVANGGFASNLSGWSQSQPNYWTWVNGRAYHANSVNYNDIFQTFTTFSKPVQIEFDYECLTASNTAEWFYINAAGVVKSFASAGIPRLAAGVGKMRYVALDGIQRIGFSRHTQAEFYIDNISVRELPGNHAYQTVSTRRPVLSARVNRLLGTETLSNQSVTTRATSQTLKFEGTGTITLSGTATAVYTAGIHNFSTTAGSLTLSVTGEVTKADLRESNLGVNLPAYQKVNTTTDYDTQGFPTYLKFDGIDDALQTNSIDFTATDKMTVFAGVRKLSDATAFSVVAELSASINSVTGAFAFYAPGSSAGTYALAVKGSTQSWGDIAGNSAPITNVLSFVNSTNAANRAGMIAARNNGSVATLSNGVDAASTGNYGNYPLYIGARAGTSLFFNGNLYQLIIAGGSVINIAEENLDLVLNESGDNITAETTLPIGISTIEACERFVNRKTLAY